MSVEEYIAEILSENVKDDEVDVHCEWCNKTVKNSCKTVKQYSNCENLKQ